MKGKISALSALFLAAALCLPGCKGNVNTAATGAEGAADTREAAKEVSAAMPGTEKPERDEAQKPKAPEAGGEGKAEGTAAEEAVILVVSFGTSYKESRDVTIGAIEEAIATAYPRYPVRRAFTAQKIIDILKERDGLEVDNMAQALDRAVADGVKTLIVQPTHLMDGMEYRDMVQELENYNGDFAQIVVGQPLLADEEDLDAVAKAVTDATSSYDDGETAVVFMGHGTQAPSNQIYASLQEKLAEKGFENYYIGTVEATPTLDDITAALRGAGKYKKVVLEPLMVVAGDHANNDMAGDGEDSWKAVMEGEGYEVECLLHGLGELKAIQDIYVRHVKAAMDGLNQ